MADQKKLAQKNYNVYRDQCPSRNVLEGISDKWSILVMNLLSQKMYRFGELKREIDGISSKMLAQTLTKLDRFGFVAKHSFQQLPLIVEYALTPLGIELGKILHTLTEWTEANMNRIYPEKIIDE